jgi:NADH-quinone oxidoreductase subunit G
MCIFEDERGNLDAACSAEPWDGMVIKTNTEQLRRYRKMILELLLANHCRDCTICGKNGNCKLQDLATSFNIRQVRFSNAAETPDIDESSLCITKDKSKCILCGDCVRMCHEIQNVGAIDFAHRGSKMTISTAFDEPLVESNCVGCGQCAAICPTGALVVRNDVELVWKELHSHDVKMVVQIAPAVRVSLGKRLGLAEGENALGKIVSALKRIGFHEVFDTATGADLTVLEEANELLGRLESGENLPLISSCCPAWVQYCENKFPELLSNISSCRSPMQMLASIVKAHGASGDKRVVHVAVMPCTAKKYEAARDEFKTGGVPNVDYVITTQELIQMIHESGIVFNELEVEALDTPYGMSTGAGVIFGVTGGVTEAVLRRISSDKSTAGLRAIALEGVRGMEGVKEAAIMVGNREVKIAVVSGLKNASDLLERVKQGEKYDFIEVMACPGGCVGGAGQPFVSAAERENRGKGLYLTDKVNYIKRSEESPLTMPLYNGILKGRVHELLHVSYAGKKGE